MAQCKFITTLQNSRKYLLHTLRPREGLRAIMEGDIWYRLIIMSDCTLLCLSRLSYLSMSQSLHIVAYGYAPKVMGTKFCFHWSDRFLLVSTSKVLQVRLIFMNKKQVKLIQFKQNQVNVGGLRSKMQELDYSLYFRTK